MDLDIYVQPMQKDTDNGNIDVVDASEEVIDKFESLTKATGKNLEIHWFDADHAFANPSSPRYDEAAAQEANGLAMAFLKSKLGE